MSRAPWTSCSCAEPEQASKPASLAEEPLLAADPPPLPLLPGISTVPPELSAPEPVAPEPVAPEPFAPLPMPGLPPSLLEQAAMETTGIAVNTNARRHPILDKAIPRLAWDSSLVKARSIRWERKTLPFMRLVTNLSGQQAAVRKWSK